MKPLALTFTIISYGHVGAGQPPSPFRAQDPATVSSPHVTRYDPAPVAQGTGQITRGGLGTRATHPQTLKNIVYGTYAGMSLTMDVYTPEKPNHIGIIIIPGTAYGYAYSNNYEQQSIAETFAKDSQYFGKHARILTEIGYTLFVINHRLSPHFHYRDVIADCQRAVRYVRFNSKIFDIDPNNIGAFGFSSGATLCSMLGVIDTADNLTMDGIDAVSSKVQCVVTLSGRFDLAEFNKPEDSNIQNPIVSRVLFNFIGELPPVENGVFVRKGSYAEASPLHFVDKGDAAFLMYNSEDDPLVPLRQAISMRDRLLKAGIKARLNVAQREGHTPTPDIQEIDDWLSTHLKQKSLHIK